MTINPKWTTLAISLLWAAGCVAKNDDTGEGGGGSSSAKGGGGPGGAGGAGPSTGGSDGGFGGSGVPDTCMEEAGDGPCDACAKTTCCTEIEACDEACNQKYKEYRDCLFPGGSEEWSGFSIQYCRMRSLIDDDSTAAGRYISCVTSGCSATDACGAEPVNQFAFPAPEPAGFSAAEFIENFCVGCHFEGFVAPSGQNLTEFSSDTAWFSPQGIPNWFDFMQQANIESRFDVIWCGVHPDVLPMECLDLTSPPVVQPGFFTKAEKFPPSGMGMDSGGNANPCQFDSTTTQAPTCPQPTKLERARMVSWVLSLQ